MLFLTDKIIEILYKGMLFFLLSYVIVYTNL